MDCLSYIPFSSEQLSGSSGYSGLSTLCCTPTPVICPWRLSSLYRLVGLVVKASASRAEDPGFESRLRQDFFGVESYQ